MFSVLDLSSFQPCFRTGLNCYTERKNNWIISVESVNSSSQQNAVYDLIIPQKAGKQLALTAALFSSELNVEKFRRAVWEKKLFRS